MGADKLQSESGVLRYRVRSRPDLIFGSSTRSDGGNGFGRLEERSIGDVCAFGELGSDRFDVRFDETHGADEDGAVGVDEYQRGDHSEAIGVGDDVAFFFGIEQDWESDAVFFYEGCRFFGAVLAYADYRGVR